MSFCEQMMITGILHFIFQFFSIKVLCFFHLVISNTPIINLGRLQTRKMITIAEHIFTNMISRCLESKRISCFNELIHFQTFLFIKGSLLASFFLLKNNIWDMPGRQACDVSLTLQRGETDRQY